MLWAEGLHVGGLQRSWQMPGVFVATERGFPVTRVTRKGKTGVWGAWLGTLDLRVVSSQPTLGAEIT